MDAPDPSPSTRLWLSDGRDAPLREGAAVPIRTILGSPASPGRMARFARVGARWGVWILALGGIGVGGYGVWHLLYGDRVEGEVWLGRPPAPLATTTTSTSTTTTTTTTLPSTTTSSVTPADDSSSGPGPGLTAPAGDQGPSTNAGPGAPVTTPPVTTPDDHGGRDSGNSGNSGNSGKGSSGSGSSGSGSSGSGSSGSGSSGSGRGGDDGG